MNLIKLTKNGQNVLVNVEHIDQIETLHTKSGVMSKVIFTTGTYCIVQETLEEIYEVVDSVGRGEKQIIDWTTTSIDDQLMEEYQQRTPYRKPKRSYNNYNRNNYNPSYPRSYGNFNENQY